MCNEQNVRDRTGLRHGVTQDQLPLNVYLIPRCSVNPHSDTLFQYEGSRKSNPTFHNTYLLLLPRQFTPDGQNPDFNENYDSDNYEDHHGGPPL